MSINKADLKAMLIADPDNALFDGLEAAYFFDEGDGVTVIDYSGNERDATITLSGGTYAWVPGVGLKLTAQDPNGAYAVVSTPLIPGNPVTGQRTVMARFAPTANMTQTHGVNDYGYIFIEPDNGASVGFMACAAYGSTDPDTKGLLPLGFVMAQYVAADSTSDMIMTYGEDEEVKYGFYADNVLIGYDASAWSTGSAFIPYNVAFGAYGKGDNTAEGIIEYVLVWSEIVDEVVIQPEAPINLTASDGLYPAMVVCNWDAVADATYKLYRSQTDDSATGVLIGSPETNTYEDETVDVGENYYYWVKAVTVGGDSEFSTGDVGYAMSSVTPIATDGLYLDKVAISWSVGNGTTYQLYKSETDDVGTATLIADQAERTYNDTDVVQDTVYYYWIKVLFSELTSGFSDSDQGHARSTTVATYQAKKNNNILSRKQSVWMD